ncbi:Molybdopterin-guanine dinucleotide biosynthesis protein A [Micromonospora nigra]|uniref:Molybdopterin-guanine dinucleotide biosynthesis protein A n=1 Tax=Micromonospora nigra TaxID=145857 RepID=A0A1C6RZB8_9ACTN|nr:Molybdopterin-guanine dinucleotide biosynthesis protein A [Micromonospora nigra]
MVLAGGAARRMGGRDKPAVPVGGQPMRDRVLTAVAAADTRVVVGPAGPTPAGVRSTREDPPGGGPVAALAAGLALLDPATTVVAVLAADLPLLTRHAVDDLLHHLEAPSAVAARRDGHGSEVSANRHARGGPPEAPKPVDGACYVDAAGRRQSLCGVWRVPALRAALDRLAAERDGNLAGASLRALLAGLAVVEVRWLGDGPPPWFDCDTDNDVRRAEEWLR